MLTTAVTKSPLRTAQNKYCNLLQRLGPGLCLSKYRNRLAVGGHCAILRVQEGNGSGYRICR